MPNGQIKAQLLAELDHLDATVAPVLSGLRQQVVHNDLNHHNVLLNPDNPDRVTGVVDFGDMVKTPLIIDLAVAASYQTHLGEDALASVCDIVGAYHTIRPLERREVALLRDLMVIPPFLTGCIFRTHAAIFSFMAGVMPPMPDCPAMVCAQAMTGMLGRSVL